jgi:hypothetical protein
MIPEKHSPSEVRFHVSTNVVAARGDNLARLEIALPASLGPQSPPRGLRGGAGAPGKLPEGIPGPWRRIAEIRSLEAGTPLTCMHKRLTSWSRCSRSGC